MNEMVAQRILSQYGLHGSGLGLLRKGYRNASYPVRLSDGRMANLILYKAEPHISQVIRRANAVSDYVSRSGLPARRTVDPRIVRLSNASVRRYAAIYTYLSGETIPWEAYTMKHLKLLGLSLNRLHGVLKDYPASSLPRVHEQYIVLVERMSNYFADPRVVAALETKLHLILDSSHLANSRKVLVASGKLPNQHALHMDFVRSNILFAPTATESTLVFENLSVSGILDFEKTAMGHPLFDIARTLAFLLVDCKHKTPRQVYKYFLTSGYIKRGKLPFTQVHYGSPQRDLLEELVDLFLMYDLYKFLRHNPYETLHLNEHFVRTRDLLIERQLVDMVK